MPVAKAKRTRRVGSPHRLVRRSCKWCRKPRHNHTSSGNTHRFHGIGSFCRTHRTTVRGRRYCKAPTITRGARRR